VPVYARHDQPCGACAHFIDLNQILGDHGGVARKGACSRKLVETENDFHITYKIGADFTAGGLCFTPGDEKTNA
jgi:hypothetical protein